MRDAIKAAAVVVGFVALALGGVYFGGTLGARDGRTVAASASEVVAAPVERHVDLPVAVTLAPAPPPTPSYNYVWDPSRHDQCFDPSDPNLPPNAPRCPLPVPPDPGGPVAVCPSGTTLVYPNHQPICEPTKP